MSRRDEYPPGVPCWVEALQPDPAGAAAFYGSLFGWQLAGSGADPDDLAAADYVVARKGGRDVAGIAPAPAGAATAWMTQVRVDSAETAAQAVADAGGTVVAGPLDLPPAGRMTVFTDPAGALLGAWEPGTREGAELVNEPSAWSMSELQTADADAAAAFYGAVFGWVAEPFGPPEAGISLFRLPGYVGGEPLQPVPRDVVAVMMPLQDGGSTARWGVDFWVADADATAAEAGRLGGRAIVPPFDAPPFRQAILADPAGAVFSISQLVTPPAAN